MGKKEWPRSIFFVVVGSNEELACYLCVGLIVYAIVWNFPLYTAAGVGPRDGFTHLIFEGWRSMPSSARRGSVLRVDRSESVMCEIARELDRIYLETAVNFTGYFEALEYILINVSRSTC